MASFVSGWAQSRRERSSLVPVSTLDALVSSRLKGKKLLIKIDVEGFELDVLAGATEILDINPKPTWLVEILLSSEVIPGGISGKFTDTFEVFWNHGYRSRMLDSARTPVERADVNRWVANGSVDSNMRNFIFSAA